MLNQELLRELEELCFNWDEDVKGLFDACSQIVEKYVAEKENNLIILDTLSALNESLENQLSNQTAARQQVHKELISVISRNIAKKQPFSRTLWNVTKVLFYDLPCTFVKYAYDHPGQTLLIIATILVLGRAASKSGPALISDAEEVSPNSTPTSLSEERVTPVLQLDLSLLRRSFSSPRFFTYSKPHPMPVNEDMNANEFIIQKLKENKGIMIGDAHGEHNIVWFLIDNMESFKMSGAKHLYLEMVASDHQEAIDQFCQTGEKNYLLNI
ncbi:MAG: hypothetical protein A3F11_00405 [Gammaproteobacteria bacterium RIFCSPHIGHO2_12_FULL_37_14]|nr:MAG: hypothetical protein A3F11_00405 [Gammaproteobacteria bacterium RIFCSPHIGHO2_12_FULL_37_14]